MNKFFKQRFKSPKISVRGQAAIFDGIMFLMLVSISVALMFNFVGAYGQAQNKVLRSSHLLNYVHSIGKSLYFVDVSTVASVDLNNPNGAIPAKSLGQGVSELDPTYTCEKLAGYKSNSVAELMKRDLSDGFFDNKYGNDEDQGNTPGRLALRCAAAELMKPITSAGFDFNIDLLPPGGNGNGRPPTSIRPIDPDDKAVSNVNDVPELSQFLLGDAPTGCDGIASKLRGKQLLAVTFPFSVFNENDDAEIRADKLQYTVRICVWPSEKT